MPFIFVGTMESISNAKILLDYNLDHLRVSILKILLDYNLDHLRVSILVVEFQNLLGLERCILQIVCNVEGSFT